MKTQYPCGIFQYQTSLQLCYKYHVAIPNDNYCFNNQNSVATNYQILSVMLFVSFNELTSNVEIVFD
jgi:hypothetical protein